MTTSTWDAGGRGGVPRWAVVAVLAGLTLVGGLLARTLEQGDSSAISVEPWEPERAGIAGDPPESNLEERDASQWCPDGDPVAVVRGVAYPPAFPSIPTARPGHCLPNMRAALAMGFVRVVTPPDSDLVGGIYLVPDVAMFPQCIADAAAIGHTLPCTIRRPHGGSVSACVGNCVTGGGYLLTLRGFASPPHWCGGCYPDLLIATAPVDAPQVVRALTGCRDHAPRTEAYFCDAEGGFSVQQSHAGHTIRQGRHGDILVAVSVHGRGPRQTALVNRMFDGLTFVGR